MRAKKYFKASTMAACVAAASMLSAQVDASHFRGAALVPSVDANGLLTIDAKSFWRLSAGTSAGSFPHSGVGTLSITGLGSFLDISISQDLTDIRRAEVNETFEAQLPGAGLYTIDWGSSSWVSGVPNGSGSYGTSSTIFWDGSTANSPILFDLENIQQEVLRGAAYSDNLDAVGSGLTYDDTYLADGQSSQAVGYSIDASGQITIAGVDTAGYADNLSNPGADMAFSGKINATDGSSVEFVWLFDAVDTGSNLAPSITDIVVNALVGDVIDETLVVTDPNGDPVTTSFINFFGPGGIAPLNFTFDPTSLNFVWDSTGFDVGTYIATFGATDGFLTDQGTITINLTDGTPPPPPTSVPEPASLLLVGSGLAFLVASRRRRKSE